MIKSKSSGVATLSGGRGRKPRRGRILDLGPLNPNPAEQRIYNGALASLLIGIVLRLLAPLLAWLVSSVIGFVQGAAGGKSSHISIDQASSWVVSHDAFVATSYVFIAIGFVLLVLVIHQILRDRSNANRVTV